MQSMQRQFGKLLNRGPGDNAKVSILLNDYEDADRLLARVDIASLLPQTWQRDRSLLTALGSDHRKCQVMARLVGVHAVITARGRHYV